ncbi:MAG: hypothetical protein ACRDOM_10650 [Nocardioides sp.]
MTDDPSLSTADEAVRRLLVDARHAEPVPPDVAARLDRVLDGLAQEPARTAPVVELAHRRRRAASLLVAAAAVVAVGLGLNQVFQPSGDEAASTGSDSAAELGPPPDGQEKPGAIRQGAGAGAESADADKARRGVVELRSRDFADDVRESRVDLLTDSRSVVSQYRSVDRALRQSCGAAAWGAGTFVPVRYDGEPAVMVFRRPQGDTQVADLFRCGSTEPDRSVTLPAP